MASDADTLERIHPDRLESGDEAARDVLRVHLDRYEFAARQIRPGRLLDMACGVGYGTHLLADRASQVEEALGVDLAQEAIDAANQRYASERVSYRQGDAMQFADPEGFDTIVSLETVEHLPDPVAFVANAVKLLRPGGRLIASVPTTPSVDVNAYHLSDFTEASFRRLVAPYGLRELEAFRQVQTVRFTDVFSFGSEADARLSRLRPNLPAYYARHPGALLKRIWTTLRHGFSNHYLTIVWERNA
ncbi:MAG: methyltransferase domain-containing protein [bacterium]|nr:methyltransferase domain-containing protein [bacterium]